MVQPGVLVPGPGAATTAASKVPATLGLKIVQAMDDIGYIQKDGQVKGSISYNFLSEEAITTRVRAALIKNRLFIIPSKMEVLDQQEVQGKYSTQQILRVRVTYRITCGDTGEFLEAQAIGEGMDQFDKKIGKALTGAYKYMQRQVFAIPTGDDPDHIGNEKIEKELNISSDPGQMMKDLNDEARKKNKGGYKGKGNNRGNPPPGTPERIVCKRCKQNGKDIQISKEVAEYSIKHYKFPLCKNCQAIAREQLAKESTKETGTN